MLLFDAGNSRCKWVRVEAGAWRQQGVLDNSDASAWLILKTTFADMPAPKKILLSNVAGAEMERRIRALCTIWQGPVELIVAKSEQCGVRNGYDQPAQLGSDRWAALIAAWHQGHGACLVVNCGTATTVDALSASGDFMGGLILPGMELMQHSLLQRTAQLGLENGSVREFPLNTADAIASGVMRANIGAIQHQFALLEAQFQASCIVSGGAAEKILPYLTLKNSLVEHLVLQGLEVIGQNCSTNTQKETVA